MKEHEHPYWNKGQRVELHPATDAWMQGDRYGTVHREYKGNKEEAAHATKAKPVHVKMDKSNKVLKVHPGNIYKNID